MTKARHPLTAALDDIIDAATAMRRACDSDDGRPAIEAAAYRLAMTRPDGLAGTSHDGVGGHGTRDGSPPPPGVDLNRTVIGDYPGKADLHALFRHLDAAAVIVARWQPHAAPSAMEREANDRDRGPKCDCCDRWGLYDGGETVHGTVAGNLPEPLNLCRNPCYQFTRKHGRLPSEAELRRMALKLVTAPRPANAANGRMTMIHTASRTRDVRLR